MIASDRIADLVRPVLESSGHDLYDVEVAGATVRVLVDSDDLHAIEQLSPAVSAALDDIDLGTDRWFLEVSSPGLERALRRPEHWVAAVGSTVKVKTAPTVPGDRRVEGTVESADDSGVVVGGRRLAYDEIERARTVFVWGPPPRDDRKAGRPARARRPADDRSPS